jgi:hypothetical protein
MGVELYIIGTSHLLQCGSAECTQSHIQVFDAEPRKLCSTLKIQRIAEEMTEDGLAHYKVNETIGQRVANDIKVSYQTVDLSIKDRSGLSLGDSEVIATVRRWAVFDGGPFREAFDDLVDGIRERVWIARLLSGKDWPILFICGSDHAVSVRRLCRRLDMETQLFTGTINPNMTFAQQAGWVTIKSLLVPVICKDIHASTGQMVSLQRGKKGAGVLIW